MTDDGPEKPPGADSGRPLKVLGWPGFSSENGNPYTRLLYEAMEMKGNVEVDGFTMFEPFQRRYDVWHVHWPEDFLSYRSPVAAYFYVAAELFLFAWARLSGTRLVWTVHDLGPHESYHPQLERLFWPLFLPMVDGIISLSETAREEAYDRFPVLRSVPSAIVPHGHYRTAYPESVSKGESRRQSGLDPEAPVMLFVGRIRPYKNVVPLVQTFRQWEKPEARLVVAGNPVSDDLGGRVQATAEGDARVRTALRFIEEDEMPALIAGADLVVLPYESIMHSGSALLALSYDRPILVPDRGAMTELQGRVGRDWVRTYTGELTPSVLADGMEWARTTDRAAQAPVDDLDWPRLARQTVALYRRVLEAHD
ncbi:glycosyltransferase family 4 protein [Salinibacter grassmerensis]|uniref:glycosyltransferase family 4 protein n=1 Tax=Salinibacter grassmerensis TaxID=3040353 RepID=UPI0021E6E997|nr:glycosyltransferase family 4 protein [Salinibacter grassmerensis]